MQLPGRADLSFVVAAAVAGDGAHAGTIELFDEAARELRIAASVGLGDAYLERFAVCHIGEATACARALGSRHRILIQDVEMEPSFAPYLATARAAGVRSVQSTVIIDRSGSALGCLSTHYDAPHRPPQSSLRLFDRLARIVVLLLECERLAERAGITSTDLPRDMKDTVRALNGLIPRLAERGQSETVAISVSLELERLISMLVSLERRN